MDKARIYVDFNEMVTNNMVLLSKEDTKADSDGNMIEFSEGMPIGIYSDDLDEFDRQDNLIADGISVRNPNRDSIAKWCCQINSFGIRHESGNPNFHLPELSTDEKRNITYKKLDKWISLIGSKPNVVIRGAMETYMKILRRIDNGEL